MNSENSTSYLTLLKNTLTDAHRADRVEYRPLQPTTWKFRILLAFDRWLRRHDIAITKVSHPSYRDRLEGRDWPAHAETMIGVKRLDNLQYCVETVINENIPGDLIECGVWRGGACIFMQAILKLHVQLHRRVIVADSFNGLPEPEVAEDSGSTFHTKRELAVTMDDVMANFQRYGLLHKNVWFLQGWFKDTLSTPQIERLAVMRLDGDMYASTYDALRELYPKLSPGGFCIIDDWGAVPACQQAVIDYRTHHRITEPMIVIDRDGVYWRKSTQT